MVSKLKSFLAQKCLDGVMVKMMLNAKEIRFGKIGFLSTPKLNP